MARIVYSPSVDEITGSIGGVTFQRNGSGTIVRSRPITSKKQGNRQEISHSNLLFLLNSWHVLSDVQKQEWIDFAVLYTKINSEGISKILSGTNWYVSVNWFAKYYGVALLNSPPLNTLPSSPPNFEVLISSSSLSIKFISPYDFVNDSIIVKSSLPTKRNSFSINQIKKLLIITDEPVFPIWDITTYWEDAMKMLWLPDTVFPNANIFVCLQTLRNSSYITSPMLCANQITPVSLDDEFLYYAQ